MNEFFGIDMTYIMIALLVILGVALSTVLYVVLRNRVMFLIGVRNIPRRRAQTTLIIVGLMLSTLIISTAFAIGDTVDYSITSTGYERLHSIDEIVEVGNDDNGMDVFGGDGGAGGGGGLISAISIPDGQADQYIDAFKRNESVDGALGVVRGPASVQNETKRLTEPLVVVVGIDPAEIEGFESDFETIAGERVSPGDLGEGEIYANEAVAEDLDIDPGDRLSLFVGGESHEFSVKDVVKDRVLTGSIAGVDDGFLVERSVAQELFGRPEEIDFIAISNDGGVREGMELTDEVEPEIAALLQGTRLNTQPIKQDTVEAANEISSVFTTIFVVLGLFSIAAGMMLIFLIFVMLAAERKVEMGMVRAVGTKRSHLVQIFMSEGMVYNLGAAAVGCLLGIGVSVIMVQMMERLFAEDLGLGIVFHVTARSLIVSYAIGVVLTFITVTFSSWRIGNLNIVSAIRDIPEQSDREERPEFRGIGGLVSLVRWLIFKPRGWRQWLLGPAIIVAGVLSGAIGFGLFIVAGELYDTSAAGSTLAVILGVFGGAGFVLAAAAVFIGLSRIFQLGAVLIVVGVAAILLGLGSDMAAPFGLGFSAATFGAAMVLAQLGLPARPVYTGAGAFLLIAWLMFAGASTPFEAVNNLEGDIDMFFVSGLSMVLAGTFLIVYNADLLLGLLTLTGGLVPRIVPSVRTAVAYPLANKFRTGMTIAMISLVMFALVMMSTINGNFDRVFLSEEAEGGYDVIAFENPGNPVDDLVTTLESAGADGGAGSDGTVDTSTIAGVDKVQQANSSVAGVRLPGDQDWEEYQILGVSDGFAENNELVFQSRATGFDSDDAVWDAIAAGGDYAVVDSFAVGGDDFEGGFALKGIEPEDRTFEPVRVQLHDEATGAIRDVQVIGVLNTASSGLFSGMHISDEVFDELYERPLLSVHYVRLQDGADATAVAQDIERTLLFQGVQAESIRKIIDDYQAQSRGFLYLIQGFMGIGLFVGIAAVGVIAFRTVVERRQQIGMLRAIGYTRGAIALSFIMESSFTALLGIVSGIALALLLAYQLMQTDEFIPGGVPSFYIPWVQILAIGGFAFIASLIMTIIPSRQASTIPIAEALRYE
ncbi:MAG: FtsX-like permease family protein [Dehalococcoidia bacterium]